MNDRILPIETTGTHGLSGENPEPIQVSRTGPVAPDAIDVSRTGATHPITAPPATRDGPAAPGAIEVSRTAAEHPAPLDRPVHQAAPPVDVIDTAPPAVAPAVADVRIEHPRPESMIRVRHMDHQAVKETHWWN